jgi:hypothetical protein
MDLVEKGRGIFIEEASISKEFAKTAKPHHKTWM